MLSKMSLFSNYFSICISEVRSTLSALIFFTRNDFSPIASYIIRVLSNLLPQCFKLVKINAFQNALY